MFFANHKKYKLRVPLLLLVKKQQQREFVEHANKPGFCQPILDRWLSHFSNIDISVVECYCFNGIRRLITVGLTGYLVDFSRECAAN
jgi:hypothetical protein